MAQPAIGALETVELSSGSSRVLLAPERGGMATRFFVGDRAVFYLDEATLRDKTKNVRGGNPVLFPSPGKLEGDRFSRDGRSGAMGQHGFARNAVFEIVNRKSDEVTLRLASTPETRAVYPWDFVATYRYLLRGSALRIEQRFEATDPEPMPLAAGFHPYFQVAQADKARARIPTRATRAWDNAKKTMIGGGSGTPDDEGHIAIDLTAPEVDLHLVDHGANAATLELGDGSRIEVRASLEFTRWVVWTLAGRDFVCLEPWTAPANALNTGDGLLFAKADAPIELWTEIEVTTTAATAIATEITTH